MRVGLTGGIAAGKSTAADQLRRLGVAVIDYDELSHRVIAPGTPGEAQVGKAFGDVVMVDGHLDKALLGQLAFADPDARRLLESLVHPLVYQQADAEEAGAVRAGHNLVVHEIPLLVEVVDRSLFDQIIVVDAPASLRAARLVDQRGLTHAQAEQRISAQASDAERRAAATYLWDGAGPPERLRAQAADWLRAVQVGQSQP